MLILTCVAPKLLLYPHFDHMVVGFNLNNIIVNTETFVQLNMFVFAFFLPHVLGCEYDIFILCKAQKIKDKNRFYEQKFNLFWWSNNIK